MVFISQPALCGQRQSLGSGKL